MVACVGNEDVALRINGYVSPIRLARIVPELELTITLAMPAELHQQLALRVKLVDEIGIGIAHKQIAVLIQTAPPIAVTCGINSTLCGPASRWLKLCGQDGAPAWPAVLARRCAWPALGTPISMPINAINGKPVQTSYNPVSLFVPPRVS